MAKIQLLNSQPTRQAMHCARHSALKAGKAPVPEALQLRQDLKDTLAEHQEILDMHRLNGLSKILVSKDAEGRGEGLLASSPLVYFTRR